MEKEKLFTILLTSTIILAIIDWSLPRRILMLLNVGTLSAIISFLLISHLIELSGLFNRIILIISAHKLTDRKFMLIYTLIVSLTAAVIMNDTSLFIFTPFIIITSKIMKINLEKSIVFTCIAANLGSLLTPFGNPQNIIIWKYYRIPIYNFLYSMTPLYVLGYIILALMILIFYKGRELEIMIEKPLPFLNKLFLSTSLILLILNIALMEMGHPIIGFLISIIIILIVNKKILYEIDLFLVIDFALMFIVFGELSLILGKIGIIKLLTDPMKIFLYSLVLSQVISNIPATIVLLNHVNRWIPLAFGVNIGGMGVIIGSMANIIVMRLSNISLKKFHKYQIPYFSILIILTIFLIIS